MAGREADRPPYPVARALGAWAVGNRHYLRGRLLLQGIRLDDLTLIEVLDVAWAAWSDGYNGFVDANEVRGKLDSAFYQLWPDRETWGMGTAAEQAQADMMVAEAQAQILPPEEIEARRVEREAKLAAARPAGAPDG